MHVRGEGLGLEREGGGSPELGCCALLCSFAPAIIPLQRRTGTMATSATLSKVILGSKSSPLSPEVVFDVAHRLASVEIDASALDRISHTPPPPASARLPLPLPPARLHGTLMRETEARAAVVVLLNKLIQAQPRIRSFLPISLAAVLNQGVELNLPLLEGDDGVSFAILRAACQYAGELGITKDELDAVQGLAAVSTGIASLAVHLSSVMCVVADAVAGLSCEALQADIKVFEAEFPNDGVSNRGENDVASDLRQLLFGSKLVNAKKGGVNGDFISSIPFTHAGFREDAKLASSKIRIEINNARTSKERNCSESLSSVPPGAIMPPFAKSLLTLVLNLRPVVSYSFERLVRSIQTIQAIDSVAIEPVYKDANLLEFEGICQKSLQTLKNTISELVSKIANDEYSAVLFSSETHTAMLEARSVLTLEAVLALALLDIRERLLLGRTSVDKIVSADALVNEKGANDSVNCTSLHTNAEDGSIKTSSGQKGVKGKHGSEKKKKGGQDMIMGKGTGLVRQFFQGVLRQYCQENDVGDGFVPFLCWADAIKRSLDLKDTGFQNFMDGIKSVLESNEARRRPKVPKGTRDFRPEQMSVREKAFGIIASVFKRHGAVALDTPVFELRETLMGKYGEDAKLIFDLADQGGEICSLRYDLTVPFARYVAMNGISNMKRYHIAKVYRRDNPSKGRYREFYQCDFDIAGHYASMVPDFEVIKVLTELLDELNIGDYEVKLNHRRLLDGMLDICGVPQSKFRPICSAIDKMDKLPWEQVRKEMVEEKGIAGETADRIGEFVQKSGAPLELLAELRQESSPFSKHEGSTSVLEELAALFEYLQAADSLHRIVFDLSLARGLDYYTGVIYEAVFKGSAQVGSIAAGGRYDNLIGMFSGKQVPAVGVSLGIERVFAIMEQQVQKCNQVIRETETEVLVVVLGDDIKVAIKLAKELWAGKVKAEFVCVTPRKLQKQMEYALEKGIPWMIIIGNDELEKGIVRLQNLESKQRDEIPRLGLVGELQKRMSILCGQMEFSRIYQ